MVSPKVANHAKLHEEFQKQSVDVRRTTAEEPDWHRDQEDHVLNNPHPRFDGFISVSPTENGGYEAVAYEFMDPEGEDISDADSKEFKTLEEAKEWGETWVPPGGRDKDTDTEPFWQSEGDGLVLTNPHPSLDGFIDVVPVGGGKYEASVYEFVDQEGVDIFNVESKEFDNIEDAKRWAEEWRMG